MGDWKRPKVLEGTTTKVQTECGNLFLTKCYDGERLIEISAVIGRNGTCSRCLLDSFCKVVSCLLQSPEARYKIVKKLDKQFIGSNCGQPFFTKTDGKQEKFLGCVDYIAQSIKEEIDR